MTALKQFTKDFPTEELLDAFLEGLPNLGNIRALTKFIAMKHLHLCVYPYRSHNWQASNIVYCECCDQIDALLAPDLPCGNSAHKIITDRIDAHYKGLGYFKTGYGENAETREFDRKENVALFSLTDDEDLEHKKAKAVGDLVSAAIKEGSVEAMPGVWLVLGEYMEAGQKEGLARYDEDDFLYKDFDFSEYNFYIIGDDLPIGADSEDEILDEFEIIAKATNEKINDNLDVCEP